jgi:hypothetical protein
VADSEESALRAALDRFLRDAMAVLEKDHVLPRPRFAPWIEVGRDYFGAEFHDLQAYRDVEAALAATDGRFSENAELGSRDFPGPYIFDALEFHVAQVTRGTPSPLDTTMAALLAGLAMPRTMVSAWAVTDITPRTSDPLDMAGVVVHRAPDVGAGTRREMLDILQGLFGPRAVRLDQDRLHHPVSPAGILVATYEDAEPFGIDKVPPSTTRIGDFVNAVRLLHSATAHPIYELRGSTASIGPGAPYPRDFIGGGQGSMSSGLDARRASHLNPSDAEGVAEVMRLIRKTEEHAAPSSLGIALYRYQMSFQKMAWPDTLIDLTIALEAALSGRASTEITFRLQVRAAALLATDRDNEGALFRDIREFYALRSAYVHGAPQDVKKIEKRLGKITRVPHGDRFDRFRADAVLDRLRDIVRRAILARLFLEENAPELWPDNDSEVDRSILAEAGKTAMREAWRQPLAALGQPTAADAAPMLRGIGNGVIIEDPA